jgi:hypothetical protein
LLRTLIDIDDERDDVGCHALHGGGKGRVDEETADEPIENATKRRIGESRDAQ